MNVLLVVAIFVGLPVITLTLLIMAFRETREPPRNRYRKGVLPNPQRDALSPRHFADT